MQSRCDSGSGEEEKREQLFVPILNLLSSQAGDQVALDPCLAWAGAADADGRICPSSCPWDQEGTRTGISLVWLAPAGLVRL